RSPFASPPLRGEAGSHAAKRNAIRVRGTLRESNSHRVCGSAPHPNPLSAKSGARVRADRAARARAFGFDFQTTHTVVIASQRVRAHARPDDRLSEAIHVSARGSMDCVVAARLAMTTRQDTTLHPRGTKCPSDASIVSLLKKEGAGNTGCWPHPRALRAKRVHFAHASTTGQPKQSGIPCAMVLTAAPRSPRCTGLVSHLRLAKRLARLDPSVGDQDHTAWPSALASHA